MKIYINNSVISPNKKYDKVDKYVEIFSLEGKFIVDKNGIYKVETHDADPIIMDDLTLDLSTESKEIVYQIPNLHLTVNTQLFTYIVNKKNNLYFIVEDNYYQSEKIGGNSYFLAEKCDEIIKMCIYEFLSSLH